METPRSGDSIETRVHARHRNTEPRVCRQNVKTAGAGSRHVRPESVLNLLKRSRGQMDPSGPSRDRGPAFLRTSSGAHLGGVPVPATRSTSSLSVGAPVTNTAAQAVAIAICLTTHLKGVGEQTVFGFVRPHVSSGGRTRVSESETSRFSACSRPGSRMGEGVLS